MSIVCFKMKRKYSNNYCYGVEYRNLNLRLDNISASLNADKRYAVQECDANEDAHGC
jgi:hypothetical protein